MFRFLAFAVMLLHLAWLGWILLGWLVTRRRPLLRWLHLVSVGWGIVVSIFPWTCPLTWAERRLQACAGEQPYEKSFLEHYVEMLVYPDVPPKLLLVCAVSVCLGILGLYAYRFRHRDAGAW